MERFNFDQLPEVVRRLYEKLEHVEELLMNLNPMTSEDDNQIMNIQEAAKFLKVSVPSIYAKVNRQEIPVSKPGKRLYFNKADLTRWILTSRKKTVIELRKEADMRIFNHNKTKDFY